METDGRRVTSSDVARAAGLSRTTVSYVLNGDFRRIPEHTRQRVLAAADSLGYKPSAAARLLRGARSRLVLMVSPGLESARDTIGGDIVTRLGQLLAEADLHLVWQLGLPSVGRAATDLAPAVVLVAPTEEEAAFADLRRRFAVPVLPAFPGLGGFLAASARAQVDHLAGLGHQRLAFVRPAAPAFDLTAEFRQQAVERRASELGLPAPVILRVDDSRESAVAVLRSLRTRTDPVTSPVTAVCAYNDQVAFALLAAADDLGLAVPEEMSVIGVDGDPLGEWTTPTLTSVRSDTAAFVSDLTSQVVALARGETTTVEARLPEQARVVERSSTAGPAR